MIANESVISKSASQNFLWVEGRDDYHVCKHILKHYHLLDAIKEKNIINKEGFTNIREGLEAELVIGREVNLAIIVDADTDPAGRWQSLRDILVRSGYNVDINIRQNGTIIRREENPTIGIWLMPDNIAPGMLEDFLRTLIPSDDVLWPFAEKTIEDVINIDCRFPLVHKSKARIHTWLSWQEQVQLPLG